MTGMCIPRFQYDELRDRDRDGPEVHMAAPAEVIAAVIDPVPDEPATAEEVLCNG